MSYKGHRNLSWNWWKSNQNVIMISIEEIIYQKKNKQEDFKIFEKINNKLSVLLTNHKRSQYIDQIWNAGGITLRHFHCASSACSRLNAFITNSFEVFSFDLISMKKKPITNTYHGMRESFYVLVYLFIECKVSLIN